MTIDLTAFSTRVARVRSAPTTTAAYRPRRTSDLWREDAAFITVARRSATHFAIFAFKDRKEATLAEDVAVMPLSDDGSKLLAAQGRLTTFTTRLPRR